VAPLSPPPTAAPGSTSRTPQGTTTPPSGGTTSTSPLASPPVDPTPPAGGGSSRTDQGLGTGTLPRTTSPSGGGEAAPSQPGGGGKSLADCMGFWDRGTHMTKQEWRAACRRTLNRLNNLKVELGDAMKNDTSKAENGGTSRSRNR
jgi:hypothetical protein